MNMVYASIYLELSKFLSVMFHSFVCKRLSHLVLDLFLGIFFTLLYIVSVLKFYFRILSLLTYRNITLKIDFVSRA